MHAQHTNTHMHAYAYAYAYAYTLHTHLHKSVPRIALTVVPLLQHSVQQLAACAPPPGQQVWVPGGGGGGQDGRVLGGRRAASGTPGGTAEQLHKWGATLVALPSPPPPPTHSVTYTPPHTTHHPPESSSMMRYTLLLSSKYSGGGVAAGGGQQATAEHQRQRWNTHLTNVSRCTSPTRTAAPPPARTAPLRRGPALHLTLHGHNVGVLQLQQDLNLLEDVCAAALVLVVLQAAVQERQSTGAQVGGALGQVEQGRGSHPDCQHGVIKGSAGGQQAGAS